MGRSSQSVSGLPPRAARLRRFRPGRADRHLRQEHIERAALLGHALDPDAAAVPGDDLLTDVEAKTHSRGVSRCAIRGSIEQAEDRIELLRGDADPAIPDRDADAFFHAVDVDGNRPTGGRVLDRVGQEVVEDLLEVVAVRHDLSGLAVLERDLVRRGRQLHPRHDLLRELAHIDIAVAKLDPARLDARDIEQLVDEPGELAGLTVDDVELVEHAAHPRADLLFARIGFEEAANPPQSDLEEARHRGDRRLELVRGHRQKLRLRAVELFELLVALLELGGGLVDSLLQRLVEGRDLAVRELKVLHARLELQTQTTPLEPARDRAAKLLDLARLDQIVVRPGTDGLDGRFQRGVSGEHDRDRVRRPLPHGAQDIEPIAVLETEVGQDQIEVVLTHQLSCQGGAGRRQDVVAIKLDDRPYRDDDALLVVDDEDLSGFAHRWTVPPLAV